VLTPPTQPDRPRFGVRDPTQTDRIGPFRTPKWVSPQLGQQKGTSKQSLHTLQRAKFIAPSVSRAELRSARVGATLGRPVNTAGVGLFAWFFHFFSFFFLLVLLFSSGFPFFSFFFFLTILTIFKI
jgi:hypothetical protein